MTVAPRPSHLSIRTISPGTPRDGGGGDSQKAGKTIPSSIVFYVGDTEVVEATVKKTEFNALRFGK